ncbi:hypothetical protein B0I35DRAFT_512522 [Stachybotrys elegans]|uniref:C3H1-type domain-containing protein n=1 Tax=Stachybotrys elegans TaxID=80388 RepID=A0A8K0SUI0_9HYPO|nr:hypothetical protein B0I35DRAFT_512522 [Stachybotrys elegans]
MSFNGYGYSYPQGLSNYAPTPTAPAGQTQHLGDDGVASNSHGNATAASYGFNRNIIPGLGLTFSNAAVLPVAQHMSGSGPGDSRQPSSYSHTPIPHLGNPSSIPPQDTGGAPAATRNPSDDVMEEGELSEGELEDIYEPKAIEAPTSHSSTRVGSAGVAINLSGQSPGNQIMTRHEKDRPVSTQNINAASLSERTSSSRERSGSYSPFLSPNELEPPVELHASHLPQLSLPTGALGGVLHPINMAEAEKQAKEAITHLWPLHVRYQDYVSEGVDAKILQELFKTMGLDIEPSVGPDKRGTTPPSPANAPTQGGAVGTEKSEDASTRATTEGANATGEKPGKGAAQLEERKDRIARLLAAKGTKASSPSLGEVAQPQNTTAQHPPAKAKALSNTKLLQQKMQALLKAREAQAQKESAGQDDSRIQVRESTENNPDAQPSQPESSRDDTTGSQADVGSEQSAEGQKASPIPGLLLSNQGGSQPVRQQKRPVASDLNDLSGPSKRPFGQKRESQPFLIDVSDDEDEMDMEIDSPEQGSASRRGPDTPVGKPPPGRDVPVAGDFGGAQVSSPGPITTPPPIGNPNFTGRPDLRSMNKMIEDMKRRIAEAEARKKAKQPQTGSVTPSGLDAHSHTDSECVIGTKPTLGEQTSIAKVEMRTSTAQSSSPTIAASELVSISAKLPKLSEAGTTDIRRSRSRAASERLTLIEAQRREQLSRLELLRSQVASIEKDLEQSLQEEARLREDVMDDVASDSAVLAEQVESNTGEILGQLSGDAPNLNLSGVELATSEAKTPTEMNAMELTPTTLNNAGPLPGASSSEEHVLESRGDALPVNGHPSPPGLDTPPTTDDHAPDEPSHTETATEVANQQSAPMEIEEDSDQAPMDESSSSDGEEMDEEDSEESSDDYEPPEATPPQDSPIHPQELISSNPDPVLPSASDVDMRDNMTTSPISHTQASIEGQRVQPMREVVESHDSISLEAARTGLRPYESPLRYFRAYRFHPQFKESIHGGFRSLTYSNKIDARKEVCPDQLTGGVCPRGRNCPFQHLEAMQLSDGQIITQLTEYGSNQKELKQKYVNGLRDLLADLRNRKIQDLNEICQGIVDYRARFHGDSSVVLALDGVMI